MNPSYTTEIVALLRRLEELSSNLYFISESEYPFEVVHYPLTNADVPSLVTQLLSLPADTKVVAEDLSYFLRNHTSELSGNREMSERFIDLQLFLDQNLQDVKVYKVGVRKITALILGKCATGEYVGLQTTVIET